MKLETALEALTEHFNSQEEWLLIDAGRSFALRRSEIDLSISGEKLLFGFLGEKGFAVWRVNSWKQDKQKLVFNVARNFNKESKQIEFVPRVSFGELTSEIELARIEKANQIANLLISKTPDARLVRTSLNQENGRFAQIIFENTKGNQTAALADVSAIAKPETFLATAILWLDKLERRKKKPIAEICLVAEEKTAKELQNLRALLRPAWRKKIKLFALKENKIEEISDLNDTNIFKENRVRVSLVKTNESSNLAQKIIQFAPQEIDTFFSNQGETLRFRGLPFVRLRKISGAEKAWFGVEQKRQILSESNFDELLELMANLKTYRRADSPNKRHEFYRLAPENWLESILRRNIRLLDANLILSPLYNQFRVAGEKIDLLAIRSDRRLVVIELKTSPDREMIFQAVGYWQKVEAQRRAGNLRKAKIFGETEISDKPPLVYLVAPALSYHRDFRFLAQTVTEEIEMIRFELGENWRQNFKVLNRKPLGQR